MKATARALALGVALGATVHAAVAAERLPLEAERAQKQRAYFTDTELLTQDARPVRFFSDVLEGQVVVLSFMYAHCVQACPLLSHKLNQVRLRLGGALPPGVRFVTLTVDPARDTPQALRRFAERQRALHDGWVFLTGKEEAVRTVLGKLGQWVDDPDDHTTAFIAGNARTNHWTKIRPDAPPEAIAAHVQLLLAETAPILAGPPPGAGDPAVAEKGSP